MRFAFLQATFTTSLQQVKALATMGPSSPSGSLVVWTHHRKTASATCTAYTTVSTFARNILPRHFPILPERSPFIGPQTTSIASLVITFGPSVVAAACRNDGTGWLSWKCL